jgi:hypothetical protein
MPNKKKKPVARLTPTRRGPANHRAQGAPRRAGEDHSVASLGAGVLVQYHADGLRAGYVIAQNESDSNVYIQPIGAMGAPKPKAISLPLSSLIICAPQPRAKGADRSPIE